MKIIIVENQLLFAEELSIRLNELGYETKIAVEAPVDDTSSETIVNIIVESLEQILSESYYDIVITNLHLKNEDDRQAICEGDYCGERILEYLKAKHPGISCLLWTADPQTLKFAQRYNLAELISKKMPANFDEICDAVKEIADSGHPVRRKIDERIYELDGVNSEIYRFLHNSGVLPKIFSGIGGYDDRLIISLSGKIIDERIYETVRLINDLWHSEPGLPRYPLIYDLGKMETSGAFWRGHRDHIIHQFLVYLLGLYIYYGCSTIKENFDKIMPERDFLKIWKICSLFHDLGYVFEIENPKSNKLYIEAISELNDFRKNCLYHYSESRGLGICLRAEDERIRRRGKIFMHDLDINDINSLSDWCDVNLFDYIEPNSANMSICLGTSNDCLFQYWKYTMRYKSTEEKRLPYVDHGIASSLVLMQQFFSLEHYIKQSLVAIGSDDNIISKKSVQLICDLHAEMGEYSSYVIEASRAIALHNINVDQWDHNHAFNEAQLTLNQYSLSLKETPMPFFLALIDVLQSWDRPLYRFPESDREYVSQSQDISIKFKDGKIALLYKRDKLRKDQDSIFNRMVGNMANYMDKDDLLAIIAEG